MAEGAPARLSPGALAGVTVLVAGGAGAVGHAAVQLARWAGATSVGEEAGLPLLRFALEDTGDAHDAVEAGVVGKVLIDLT